MASRVGVGCSKVWIFAEKREPRNTPTLTLPARGREFFVKPDSRGMKRAMTVSWIPGRAAHQSHCR